ncbi:insecticidal toxin complex protein TccC [Pseudomonas sp. SJZ080]|uniref:RHS repeat-associated core domain-containing protein n=1 Tax=Pseudomonas sp. SJZ080 TaxID=2572888 RepID=UPI001199A779|nr:RHS repeat-associated core domain-containing protein [Pseudomonas sp. SJZ080]TWC53015.1 insecticidal toxin complex protein TccC [Pseudomonas sp. SJZ080]
MDTISLHHGTPKLAVIDPRGLAVRNVAYWRGESGQTPQARVTRQVFDAAGRGVEQWDARLLVPALSHCYSLAGKALAEDGVDAGWRVLLLGQAEEVQSRWDSRGTRQDTQYDGSLRPVAVTEQAHREAARVVERFEYGVADPVVNPGNQCGRVTRHDDPAGTRHMPAYDLLGLALSEISHYLNSLDPPDWPRESSARDLLLEPVPGLESRWTYNPLGDLLSLIDAKKHRRHFTYTVAGQLKEGWLQPANTAAPGQCLVHGIRYNPGGKVEREIAGNDVVTEADYALDDGRLLRLCAGLPNAEPLQDLRYTVDPIGNILQIDNHALPIRYYKNQRVDGQCIYGYDTVGQLTHASGWEAERSSLYPGTAYRSSANPNAVVNYDEEYDYDAVGNMIELRHLGVQPFTRRWAVAANSNRSLIEDDQPPDFDSHFDDNGNLQFLQRGQAMTWDLRNQLSSVSPVVREDEDDDTERYRYGGGGKRLRKVRTALAAAHIVITEVRYLPGLEIHHRPGGKQHEVLDLEAGRNRVKWLHGVDAPDHSLRYLLTDHLGSVMLELDEQAKVQSREVYYPFGGTAWEDHSDQSGAYKTIRYSGKERDATGLYYYGFRYLAPWLCRWINPDPAGAVDGLNVYCFVGNSPVGRVDRDGRMWSGNESLFGEDSQESLETPPHMLIALAMAGSSDLPEVIVHPDDLNSQDSLADLFKAPVNGEEAELAYLFLGVTPSPVTALPSIPLIAGLSSATASTLLKPYSCSMCSRTFRLPQHLAAHVKAHTNKNYFKCDSPGCNKSFSHKTNFNQHFLTHSGVKPFKCDLCEESFAQKITLTQHTYTHTKNRPYKCDWIGCRDSFSQSSTLAQHKLKHTDVRSFKCDVCGKAFQRKTHLERHVWTHRATAPCQVEGCFSKFSAPQTLRQHMKEKHPNHTKL